MSAHRTKQLGKIRRAGVWVELRMRLDRALRVLPITLTIALALTAATLTVRKVLPDRLSDRHAWEILLGAGLFVLFSLIVAMLRRLPPRAGTLALDRHHQLADRLTNALEFDELPAKQRSSLMEIAIDDACEKADALRPAKAAPIRVPQELLAPLVVGAGALGVALLYVPKPPEKAPQLATIDALTMTPDDLELFREAAKQLNRDDQSPEVKAAIERFNQLVEDIANKRLDRTEAFRRMEAIERELLKGAEADAKALEEALKDAAAELKKSDLAKPLAESLEKKDLDKAQKDLKELAKNLRGQKKPDKKSLERLRDALAKAAARKKEALAAINEKRSEIREQLLKKKSQKKDDPDAGPKDKEEERLLKKKERELERLDREAEQKERAGRKLDRLDRELAKAAEDLMRDLGMSAEDLEQAAEDINRLQQEEMSEKEKEELRQRLEELRELLRQQGQGGKKRMARLLKFGRRANGGQGQKGQGNQGQGQEGEEGEEGQEGQNGKEGQNGQNGQSGQGNGGKQWVLGPGGKKILMPGMGQGSGQDGQGQKGNSPGQGSGQGGKEAGSGHDGNLAGKKTDMKTGTTDVQAQGIDSQQGPSNSEVILSAAERGFKGSGYKKVFTQYHTVAEQQINKDKVPDGYRFYVHRYFQLIRPRD